MRFRIRIVVESGDFMKKQFYGAGYQLWLIATVFVVAFSFPSFLQAQTCNDWKAVVGWQGTYTLASNGTVMHGSTNRFFISETSGATTSMPTQIAGLCNQIGWAGPDLHNTGSVTDSSEVLNACQQGQWFTTDTLTGDSGYPSDTQVYVNATGGTFSLNPISHDYVTHTIYNCDGSQSGQEEWATFPANNWPISFPLPQQVGPLVVNNYHFSAASRYAGYSDIDWTISFNLTPILAGYNALTVTTFGTGTVTSNDGLINCPGICSHYYSPTSQITLTAVPGAGFIFAGWNGSCTGTGPCQVTMSQAQTVNAVFSQPLQFVAVPPCRVVDTRGPNGDFGGPPLQGGTQRNFVVPQGPCGIPTSAQAYSLNITVAPSGHLRYLTVWPTGQSQPVVSTMNSPDGRTKANAAIVSAGTDGAISFYVTDTTNLIVDIDGYFESPTNGTAQFFPLPPCRVIDTRGPNGFFGGPYLSGGVQRDFTVSQSGCVPFFYIVQGIIGHGNAFFSPAVAYPAGDRNRAVVFGDFNGDGKPDLATANEGTSMSVLLGNGGGSFQSPTVYAAGNAPYSIAQGDFNHDGKTDLVVANHDSNNVSVFLGIGDGTFHPAVNYTVGTGPHSVAVADFNGDTKPDLVTANDAQGNVSVLLGNGDGTFQAAVNYTTGGLPYSVAVGDFNGDHKLDLVTANYVGNTVSVLVGNGNGTFQAPVNHSVGSNPSSVAVGDFNQDNKADLAVTNYSSNSVSVLLGNGNGTFQAPTNYTTGQNPTSVVIGEVSSIYGDLVVTNNTFFGQVNIFENVGNGTFLAPVNIDAGTFPRSTALGDLDGDGLLDIAVATEGAANHLPAAYSFNVTVVPHNGHTLGYLTVWPQDEPQPLVSTLNNPTATTVANAAIVPGGDSGNLSVYPSADTDLIVDINGYFSAPAGTGLALYPFPPCRSFDSRNNNGQPFRGEKTVSVVASPCAPPTVARSYVLNATVVPQAGLGYLTLWPDGQTQPLVSTLNAPDGLVTSNMAILPTTNGSIDAYASALTQLLLDISGYFAP